MIGNADLKQPKLDSFVLATKMIDKKTAASKPELSSEAPPSKPLAVEKKEVTEEVLGAPSTPGNKEIAARALSCPEKAEVIEVQKAPCVEMAALAANPVQKASSEKMETAQRVVASHESASDNAWVPKKRRQAKKPSFLSSLTLPAIRPPASSSNKTAESDKGSVHTMPSQTQSAQQHQRSAAEKACVISDITRAVFLADDSSAKKEASDKQPTIADKNDSNALNSESFHSI